MASGTPLQQPRCAVNSNVRDMVDQIHQQSAFRSGSNDDMPYTAYGPSPPGGERTPPPGLLVDQTARPKSSVLKGSHSGPQPTTGQYATCRRTTTTRKGNRKHVLRQQRDEKPATPTKQCCSASISRRRHTVHDLCRESLPQ